ncbi:MAG: cellulase family glycosylhydrolase [Clostridia bacterium]|nr:cellulase family glycosylhydrolase [Clostridia bacterium]MBR3552692.1 cellulase family glycosylhydrolase [Clostridia bacterium]
MKRTLNKTLSLLLALLLTLSCFAVSSFAAQAEPIIVAPLPFLHTEGEAIVNDAGETVVLRGTNFGGWGIMEDWFCPYTSPAGEEIMFQTLVSRFGLEATHALMQEYRRNWITEVDYQNVAALGMNAVRLPIWYRNFQSDDNGTWYRDENGEIDLHELDEVVALCKKYGLYLIIDLHGLPGYQNDYDHCGQSKSMHLFDDDASAVRYREVVKDFWVTLADRYKDEPNVAMYDLMNEPLGTNITSDKNYRQVFFDYTDELYDAIRAVDSRHIISVEAIWSPDAAPAPSVYGWENIVYQEHLYDVTNPTILRKANEITKANYNAPFLIGEFYPRGATTFGYLFSIFNKRGLSWTTWTYKGAGPKADQSPWFLYGSSSIEKVDFENDSYETLMQKFGPVLRTDSGAFSRTAFADYAANFVNGEVDAASLYSFGLIETRGTAKERLALLRDKLAAIVTTIRDWLRKLKTGDLL